MQYACGTNQRVRGISSSSNAGVKTPKINAGA